MSRHHPPAAQRGSTARLALASASLFIWGVPLAVVLLAAGVAGAAIVSLAPGTGWLVILGAGLALHGGLQILHPRRPARAIAPGVDLARGDEAALWSIVDRAAEALAITAPECIRLTADGAVTAADHGRRIAIGLAWLSATKPAELVTAVAHALVRERAGAGTRTMRLLAVRLEAARDLGDAWPLGAAWEPYRRAGDRLLRRAAQRQADAADAACAELFGDPSLEAYGRVAERNADFPTYWADDVAPCMEDGFVPPILAGWRDALQPSGEPPLVSATLTRGPRKLERALLRALFPDSAETLVDLEWDHVADAVWLPRMRKLIAQLDDVPPPFTPSQLASTVQDHLPRGLAHEEWAAGVASMLTLALVEEGWTARAPVGRPIEVEYDDMTLWPFGLCEAVLDGSWDPEGWAEFTEVAGIADLHIDAAVIAPAGEAPGPAAWPLPTALPPSAPRRLALAPAPGRRGGLAIVAFGALLGLPTVLSLFVAVAHVPTPAGRVFMVCLGLATFAGLALWMVSRLRILLTKGELVVTSAGLTIDHAGLLKEPFEIPRSAVRAVVIDDGAWSDHRRFPVARGEFHVPGEREASDEVVWLWAKDELGLVPLLGIGNELPNVALLVRDPTLEPRVRRVVLTGPIPGEALTGMMLAVADPVAARTALAPWGLTRGGSISDLQHVLG